MSNVMIALVSDQRMQNVIPLLQAGARYSELVLVVSKERRTGKPLPRYAESANDLMVVLKPYLRVTLSKEFVDPYDIEAVSSTIGSLLKQSDSKDNVEVNISGGTKPMAIGALRAARGAGVTCLYTNTEDGEILRLAPDGSACTEPIRVVGLDVPLYIRAYGEEIASSRTVADLNPTSKVWAEIIGDNHRIVYQKVIQPVTSAIKKAHGRALGFPVTCRVTPSRRQRDIIDQLARESLWTWDQIPGEIAITDGLTAGFLNGIWVEVYLAMQLERSGLFDEIRLNVKLIGVEGEIDVVAVSNGKLVLFECKSNVQQSQQLSKLDSFRRRLGGPYAQAYYARASEAYANRIRKQCEKFRIDGVFFGAEVHRIGEEIGKNMGGTP
jgi:hypothetical protein